mmetsp:Transcript_6064/g.8571  ORF Transcript_6064/g.8571 Transcript_6064/m.8571 type:complete len:270 (+) Transcript_6064:127-936(+)|eukprot:CAMPEP_0197293000 /NCGR_PEP_ID=MMETSP0890-20130614/26279_1 /TAXON_ID=44058 ORGANISM="Aureoumbra lagunensis, Strain CCMP1510" /NCGR_SAMPLE_ID=MMETSP0890 /ASSEMBLY_ACC=CAM_ASM_000533 /LENGTH=269 /DNA_ID=CAMNT_0042767379 /DNA_START=60 /DNA_END=869 /DNA_ORIENTATION=-
MFKRLLFFVLLLIFAGLSHGQKKPRRGELFTEKLAELETFINTNGHSDVPRTNELGMWLAVVRRAARDGKLPKQRLEQLRLVGASLKPLENRWEEGFRLATQFVKRQGSLIPPKHLEEGQPLRAWLNEQRKAAHNGILSAEHQARLADLGLLPVSKEAARSNLWLRHLETLKKYRKREGHAAVPRSHVEEDSERGRALKLGQWLSKQKARAQQGKLSDEQRKQLLDLGVRLDTTSNADRRQQVRKKSKVLPEYSKNEEKKERYWKFVSS